MDVGFPARHGAADRRAVRESLGATVLRAALLNRVLLQPWRGVIILASRETDPLTRAAAGLLAAGTEAVLSHDTAAALHGCSVLATHEVHVTVPYSHWAKSRNGLVVHHDRFAPEDVEERNGLPVLGLEPVLAEVLCTRTPWRALACLDQALTGLDPGQAKRLIAQIDRRLADRDDRRGTRTAEALLCLGTGKAESPQESRLRLLLAEKGFPAPEPQYEVPALDGTVLYRLDLAWPTFRIALEYDGYEAHEDRSAEDLERDRRLAARGWLVVRVRKDVFEPGHAPLRRLEEAFRVRRIPLGA